MKINEKNTIALFLFAHQDDEFGVFYQLEKECSAGNTVYCIYVTDGTATASAQQRNSESISVLLKLGVSRENIIFIGQELSITDGRLYDHVNTLVSWLDNFFDNQKKIKYCYVPAWEGGHPDHDMLHAITVHLMAARNQLANVRQYPLYNGFNLPGPLFSVMSTLKENGPVDHQHIPLMSRLRYIRLCLSYPSQWKTWVGLLPFVCVNYLYKGSQKLQAVNIERLSHPPHNGRLYYERRSFACRTDLQKEIKILKTYHYKNLKS